MLLIVSQIIYENYIVRYYHCIFKFFKAEASSFHVILCQLLEYWKRPEFQSSWQKADHHKNQEWKRTKTAVLNVLTNLMFAVKSPEMVSMTELKVEKEYLANLRVYTSKNPKGVEGDLINFFEAVDIDQNSEDFIRAYWIYPSKMRFELIDMEEP